MRLRDHNLIHSKQLGRLARIGTVMTVSALSLGAVNAQPLNTPVLKAKAQSLTPVAMAPAAVQPIVEEEVVVAPAPVVAAASAPKRSGGGGGGGCDLAYIKAHESHGNYQAINGNGHYGAYQMDNNFWKAYGDGSAGRADQASASSQDAAAAKGYAKRGSQPWSVC